VHHHNLVRITAMGPLAVGLLQALLVAALLVDPQRLLTAPIRSGDYTPQALAVLRGPFRPADPGAHEMFRGGLRQLRSDWWIHVLVTEPPLPITEVRAPGSPVGFIAVRPEGSRAFTIRLRRLFEFSSVAN
jgi:hypothetical protein